MASLQGALPSVSAPVGISHASSLGVLPQTMQPQSPSHVSTMPPQSPYALALSTSKIKLFSFCLFSTSIHSSKT